jgi:hypothetical protein
MSLPRDLEQIVKAYVGRKVFPTLVISTCVAVLRVIMENDNSFRIEKCHRYETADTPIFWISSDEYLLEMLNLLIIEALMETRHLSKIRLFFQVEDSRERIYETQVAAEQIERSLAHWVNLLGKLYIVV